MAAVKSVGADFIREKHEVILGSIADEIRSYNFISGSWNNHLPGNRLLCLGLLSICSYQLQTPPHRCRSYNEVRKETLPAG